MGVLHRGQEVMAGPARLRMDALHSAMLVAADAPLGEC